jgi:hypothetical protein
MKRFAIAAGAAFAYPFVLATTALADSSGTPRPGGPSVLGDVVTPPAGTAFTGVNLAIWLVAIVALVVVGATLLVLGRRRAASVH